MRIDFTLVTLTPPGLIPSAPLSTGPFPVGPFAISSPPFYAFDVWIGLM
jgi:hypothetical protein